MTHDDVMAMEAGREMDALIANKVMGIEPITWNAETKCHECGGEMRYCGGRSWCGQCHEWRHSPYRAYSDDIAAAWEVVEKMREEDAHSRIETQTRTTCTFWKAGINEYGPYPVHAQALTAPLAICRAVLLAVTK